MRDDSGRPLAGVNVWVVDSSGGLTAHVATGADGTVSINVPRPATLTVEHSQVNGVSEQTQMRTFVDVENGDDLSATMLSDIPAPSVLLGTAHFLVASAFSGANLYQASALGCLAGASTTNPSMTFKAPDYSTCTHPMVDPIALALDTAAADPALAFSIAAPITTAALFSQTVNFPAWRTDWNTATFDLTSLLAATTRVDAFLQPETANGPVVAASIDVVSPTGDIHLSRNLVPVTAVSTVFSAGASASNSAQSNRFGRVAGSVTNVSDVFGTDLLPFVSGPQIAVAGSDTTLSWTGGGDPAATDFVSFFLLWFHTPNHTVVWNITAPPQAGTFRLPRLPDDLATYRPNRVTGQIIRGVTLYDVDGYAGYVSAVRNGGPAGSGIYSMRSTQDSK